VHVDFEALIFESGEESFDSIGVTLADVGVEEAGVDKSFGDALLSDEELLALEALYVRKPFLVGGVACHMRPRGRVEWTQSVRFGLCGIGFRTNRAHNCLVCRVNGGVISTIACKV
jgi:hypothetical protein